MATVARTADDLASTARRDALLADLEDLWRCLDELCASLAPNDWSRKHGKDWIFADLPYHLSYFDRELVAEAIARGPHVPAEEQRLMRTIGDVNAWNARHFAARPAGQPVAESLRQMRASRVAIRQAATALTDADLDRPLWCPLPGMGWLTVQQGLTACLGHTWSHFIQFRLHLKRDTPVPRPSVTRGSLAMYVGILPIALNRTEARKLTRPFSAVMDFSSLAGATWTIEVADGVCRVTEGRAARPDLVLTQSPETFVKTMNKMHNPLVAMLTRKIKVRGFAGLGTFGKLFPPLEDENTVLEAPASAALGVAE